MLGLTKMAIVYWKHRKILLKQSSKKMNSIKNIIKLKMLNLIRNSYLSKIKRKWKRNKFKKVIKRRLLGLSTSLRIKNFMLRLLSYRSLYPLYPGQYRIKSYQRSRASLGWLNKKFYLMKISLGSWG